MNIIINNRESILASQNNFRVKMLFMLKDFFCIQRWNICYELRCIKNDSPVIGNLLRSCTIKRFAKWNPEIRNRVFARRQLITAWKESRLISLGRKCRYFRVVKDIDIVSINCALFTADIVNDARWITAITQSEGRKNINARWTHKIRK